MKNLFEPFFRSFSKPEDFDHYLQWLGIEPNEQPPTPHRLLGLSESETNSEIIHQAARQQIDYVKKVAGERHAELANSLIVQIEDAATLLTQESYRQNEAATIESTPSFSTDDEEEKESLDQELLNTVISENETLKKKSSELMRISKSYQQRLDEKIQLIEGLKDKGRALELDVEKQKGLSIEIDELKQKIGRRDESIAKRNDQIKDLTDELAELKSEIKKVKEEKSDLAAKLTDDEIRSKEIDNLKKQVAVLESTKKDSKSKLTELEFANKNLVGELKKAKDEIEKLRAEKTASQAQQPIDSEESLHEATTQPVQKEHPTPHRPTPESEGVNSSSLVVNPSSPDGNDDGDELTPIDQQIAVVTLRIRDKKNSLYHLIEQTLSVGQTYNIGKIKDFCSETTGTVPFEDDKKLSRRHFSISLKESSVTITDRGSKNGTRVLGHATTLLKKGPQEHSCSIKLEDFPSNKLIMEAGELFLYDLEVRYEITSSAATNKDVGPDDQKKVDQRESKQKSAEFNFDDSEFSSGGSQSGASRDSLDLG